jgi:hypothetical protein
MNKLIIVALLSGLGSGVTVALFLPQQSSDKETMSSSTASTVKPNSDGPTLARTVKALEDDLRYVRARLADLEAKGPQRKGPKTTIVKGAVPADGEGEVADERSPQAPVAHVVEALEADESPLRVAVQGMINDSMENRRQEWRAVRRAAHEARDQDRLKGFFEKVELSEGQSEAMTTRLEEERKQIGSEWRKARQDMQFEGMRDRMRDLRRQTDADLGEVLSNEQLEQWQSYRKENWGRRRR